MSARPVEKWLVVACVSALVALVLMTWQVFDPTVWPVMVAMSVGQALGTASLAVFAYVVFVDHRTRRAQPHVDRARCESAGGKPPAADAGPTEPAPAPAVDRGVS